MPLARSNAIGVTLYGGTILPGIHGTREINVGTVYESIG